MATYPVVNTKTGETKEVVMSIHDWDQWKEDNPEWIETFRIPRLVLVLVKLVSIKINLSTNTQVGMKFSRNQKKSAGIRGRMNKLAR